MKGGERGGDASAPRTRLLAPRTAYYCRMADRRYCRIAQPRSRSAALSTGTDFGSTISCT